MRHVSLLISDIAKFTPTFEDGSGDIEVFGSGHVNRAVVPNVENVDNEMPLENIIDAWTDIIQDLDEIIGGVSDIEQESAEEELLPGRKFEFHKVRKSLRLHSILRISSKFYPTWKQVQCHILIRPICSLMMHCSQNWTWMMRFTKTMTI